MSAIGGASGLVQAVKELTVHWDVAKARWRDVKSREFEERFIEDLPQHIFRAARAVEEIDAVLRKIRSDCE